LRATAAVSETRIESMAPTTGCVKFRISMMRQRPAFPARSRRADPPCSQLRTGHQSFRGSAALASGAGWQGSHLCMRSD
jgi:hypothetical protein